MMSKNFSTSLKFPETVPNHSATEITSFCEYGSNKQTPSAGTLKQLI